MVFINKLADHSHHDDLRVDDELVVQNLKLPTNATVTGLTVNHIQGLSDSLGNLTIDESALLADVNTQIAGKADASDVYTQTELDTMGSFFGTKPPIIFKINSQFSALSTLCIISLKIEVSAKSFRLSVKLEDYVCSYTGVATGTSPPATSSSY